MREPIKSKPVKSRFPIRKSAEKKKRPAADFRQQARERHRVQPPAAARIGPRLRIGPDSGHRPYPAELRRYRDPRGGEPDCRRARGGRRSIADRNGMALLTAERPEALARMRCAEDLFSVVGYSVRWARAKTAWSRRAELARQAPFVEAALRRRVLVTPGSRSGQRLAFRVVVRTVGNHEYRRVDLQKALERGIAERGDRRWRLDENGEVEFWATLAGRRTVPDHPAQRRSDAPARLQGGACRRARCGPRRRRRWRCSRSRPTTTWCSIRCAAPARYLIERAHLGRYQMLLGGDSNPEALAAARENVGPRYKPIELRNGTPPRCRLATAR